MRILQISAPSAGAELAADRLWGAGARAVEEVELAGGRVGLRSVLAGNDATSLARLGPLPDGWQAEWIDVADEPAQTWRSFARPIAIGDDLVIRPAWCAPIGDGRLEIEVEPGGSFGLGDHPTTRLSAAATRRLVEPGSSVLDVGCGSGVLGIVAALRGASNVVAIDIAEAAVEATVDNARRNGVASLVDASSTPITEIEGPYDLVVANILAPSIIAMADDLRRVLGPGGALLISGVLAERFDHVVAALHPLRIVSVDTIDAWAALELRW